MSIYINLNYNSILMHEGVPQVERLLRVIYRSHNVYCVHVDLKATQKVSRTTSARVAQSAKASDTRAVGRGFEPRPDH